MGKTVGRIIGVAALAAVAFVPGVGAAISGAILSATTGALGTTFAALSVAGALTTAVGGLVLAGGLKALSGTLGLSPRIPQATLGRLNVSFDPDAPRKLVLGETAMATDMIYWEPSGSEQEYADYVIALAAHAVESIDEIWFDNEKGWTAAGGAQGRYAGYLTVTARTEGTAANAVAINGGTVWNSTCRLTGCAYVVLRIKRTGNSKKAESPFAGGLGARLTVRGKGMRCYDPRQDSTRGGSGLHRADNQATWTWGAHCRNPAIQSLNALLGWRIGGEISVGGGIPPARIRIDEFAAAANICDETVPLDAGGTQLRYVSDGIFTDADGVVPQLDILCAGMNAEIRDVNGGIGIRVRINDLAGPQVHFTADDVLGEFSWEPDKPLNQKPNIVRGRYIDATDTGLYQPTPYEEVRVAAGDGINRVATLDLPTVQDARQARRIAQQVLRRLQQGGTFTADFGPKAWAVRPGDPVRLTFAPAGLVNAQFRVVRQEIRVVMDGETAASFCPMVLEADDAAIYGWAPASDELVPDAAVPAVPYDPARNLLAVATDNIEEGATRNVPRGDWASGTYYVRGDFVNDAGNAWSCVVTHISASGNRPPSANWALLVSGGDAGAPGGNAAVAYIYQRAATAPAAPSATATYTFSTGAITGLNNGWSATVPAANGQPLWVRTATAFAAAATDTIAPAEWSGASVLAQDGAAGSPGADGANGAPGLSAATVFIYQRAAALPAAPSTTATYTFATGGLTGLNNGWSASVPPSTGQPLWVRQASASSTGATDTIAAAEWSAGQKLAEDGAPGAPGGNAAVAYIYQRAATAPAAPSATATYTFATGAISGLNNGWSATVPAANGQPLWVRTATAFAAAATDTIAPAEWSGASVLAQDGAAGLSAASVFIYQRAATLPAAPSVAATYTFATGAITGLNNGWSATVPAANGQPLWVRQASASSTGATDTIAAGEWSAGQKLAEDGAPGAPGADGADGAGTLPIYRRASTQPATPAPSAGVPAGWYAATGSVPAGSEPMWVSVGTRPDTASSWTWPVPTRIEAISANQTGQSVPLGFVTSTTLTFTLQPGQSRLVRGQIVLDAPTGSGTAYVQIETREQGGTWQPSNGPGEVYIVAEPVAPAHQVTITNSGAVAITYEARGTGFRTNSNSGPVTVSRSTVSI